MKNVSKNPSGKYLSMTAEQSARADAAFKAAVAREAARLPHCTFTFAGHYALCDRDGHFCSLESTHKGPCKPHGQPR